ncbi:GIY-YIG nuclease family protein [uncultured Clostridium sp.]|uniref:GIY-YIG nuclease family protein n=1 Tax=uncultured Clostridium sp. TaxID=59620 RepID=UPI0025FF1D3F|nr:GIY-YIG nuclease family protein [uncultured Clostridium sp.]
MLYKLSELKELPTSEYIYCLKFKDKLKIGKSINPYTRARTLRTQSGEEISNIFVIQSDFKLEQLAHQHFAKYRTIGEYFKGLDFNEVCQWLEENRMEVKDLKIKYQEQKEYIKKNRLFAYSEDMQNRIKWQFNDIDIFLEDLIDRVPDSPKKEKHIRNIIYLGKNLKEIYVCCIQKEDFYQNNIIVSKESIIAEEIYVNVVKNLKDIINFFGWKTGNNWLYKFRKMCEQNENNINFLYRESKCMFIN